jgi:hypothetical protein
VEDCVQVAFSMNYLSLEEGKERRRRMEGGSSIDNF